VFHRLIAGLCGCTTSALLSAAAWSGTDPPRIDPAGLPRVGTIDPRFQSYNIEMVEITGGNFWRPYRSTAEAARAPRRSNVPEGVDADLFQYRPPIDLTNSRLRMLAAALGPAYLRVSGTWANTTFFADVDRPRAQPPPGFKGVLTRRQWQEVVRFSQAVDAPIVTSFGIGAGNRDAAGVWTPEQARSLLAATDRAGGSIAAAEFMNEPNLGAMGGAPAGYDAAAYGADFKRFRAMMEVASPKTLILGPGTVGETPIAAKLLAASGAAPDVVSYHYYAMVSQRCHGGGTPEAALSDAWLSGTDKALAFYRTLRDRFAPGKPIWLTETAEAACGGNPWAATFVDTFRYLDQLGRLARGGVQIVMHNTLAASDYGLLDERTLQPRPNYWGALLWRRLMGATVLDVGPAGQSGLHVYAHCQSDTAGGVSLLVINTDRATPHALSIPVALVRYTLSAANPEDVDVRLNGLPLQLDSGDRLPQLAGVPAAAGTVTFAPATITFLAAAAAGNDACR
jgi:glycosyl hydrolase family 79